MKRSKYSEAQIALVLKHASPFPRCRRSTSEQTTTWPIHGC